MERDIFLNISPLDHRYWLANEELFNRLQTYLSFEAMIKYQAKVEAALAFGLSAAKVCPPGLGPQVEAAALAVTALEVVEEEGKTKHDIRALVNCLRRRVDEELRPYVHLGVTSSDIIDTSNALRLKACCEEVVVPVLQGLLAEWQRLALKEASTVQIGRTHGQYAVPITFGFAVAGYVSRLSGRIAFIQERISHLKGKMSGGVGAYNALSLVVKDPKALEKDVLNRLGLEPADHSTQIVQPEPALDLFHGLFSAFGVLANFADDMRHLQRSEIGEVAEAFSSTQVGSSTMPHKKNPWNFENVKSMWKAFVPRMLSCYMDQISEHQRDLSNSASGRFAFEVIPGLCAASARLTQICKGLVVDHDRMNEHLGQAAQLYGAEPLYILLSLKGHPDAHEAVRKLAMSSREKKIGLGQALREDPSLRDIVATLTEAEIETLTHPSAYVGLAPQIASDLGR